MSATICQHLVGLSSASFPSPATPGACEDCLREGTSWVALRLCRECGHVGCCDSSPSGMRRVISMRRDIPSSARSRQPQHSGRGVTCTS